MAVSPTRRAKRAHGLASFTKRVSSLLDALAILDNLAALDAPSKRSRSTLVARERRPFETYIKPMLQDHTFSMRFRMEYDDFRVGSSRSPATCPAEEPADGAAAQRRHPGGVPGRDDVAIARGGVHLRVHGRPCHREEYGIPRNVDRDQRPECLSGVELQVARG
ncbi:unnamed protein product [Ectocarpus sp. CCAP 1310/34]|nr:unnamed protein product [Ectocarpus sp. CCAP 1310/34]